MARSLNLELVLKARDYAGRVIESLAQKTTRANQQMASSTQQSAKTQQSAVNQTARVTAQAARTGMMSSRQLAQAREGLGIRSERQIQREIQRTIAQYNRLQRSGMASSRELARAHEQVRNRVRALNIEMGRTPTGQRLGNIARGGMGVVAGVAAGSMVMAEPVRKSMSYDRELAMVANTAFSERDVKGRIEGKGELHNAVKQAMQEGGGTKEEALAALDQLLASGTVSTQTAMSLLPTLQKGAVATGTDTRDLASIAISAMQQFKIDESQIAQVLDMAVAAGQAGNFELKDMARWLPQQMAAANQMGLTGIEGLKTLLVANQQARVTAGSSDSAGNNLVNLLAKVTAKETSKRFENLEYVDSKGKKRQIDYIKSMESYKAQGKDSLQAFMAIMDDVIGANADYKALQQKLKTAKGEEQKALLDQMANLVEGTAIGEIISDREALMALLGIRNNVKLGNDVNESIDKSQGAVNTSFEVIKNTNDFKAEEFKNTAEMAQIEGLKQFNDVLGQASEHLTQYMKQYPELSATLAGLGTGVQALGVAALAAAGSIALLGGRNGRSLFDLMPEGRGSAGGRNQTNGRGQGRATGRPTGGRGVGKWLSFGSEFLGGVGILSTAFELGKEQPYQQAQQEIAKEKREPVTKEAMQAYANALNNPKPMGFAYGGMPMSVNSKGVPLYGGYALAHLNHDDRVAQARYELGDYSESQYQARLQRNQAQREAVISPQGLSAKTEPKGIENLGRFALHLSEMATGRQAMQGQLDSISTQFGQYHQEIQALTASLPLAIEAGLASQSHTLNNHIVVELDGRVVSETTAQRFFNEAIRG